MLHRCPPSPSRLLHHTPACATPITSHRIPLPRATAGCSITLLLSSCCHLVIKWPPDHRHAPQARDQLAQHQRKPFSPQPQRQSHQLSRAATQCRRPPPVPPPRFIHQRHTHQGVHSIMMHAQASAAAAPPHHPTPGQGRGHHAPTNGQHPPLPQLSHHHPFSRFTQHLVTCYRTVTFLFSVCANMLVYMLIHHVVLFLQFHIEPSTTCITDAQQQNRVHTAPFRLPATTLRHTHRAPSTRYWSSSLFSRPSHTISICVAVGCHMPAHTGAPGRPVRSQCATPATTISHYPPHPPPHTH